MNLQRKFAIDDPSHIADARRQAVEMARTAGLDETDQGRVALVMTEASTNLIKHAGHGQLLVRCLAQGTTCGIEVMALDDGPGLHDSDRSFEDGHSTTGTAGTGLGSLSRMSDEFDWYSLPGQGAIFRMAIWPGRQLPPSRLMVGAVCVPYPGEHVSGDDWRIASNASRTVVMVADGLGHGVEAFRAARAATELLAGREHWSVSDLLQEAHGALRATRGAAISLASLDLQTGHLQFAGVGNVSASVHDAHHRKQMITHNGIVGHNMRRLLPVEVELDDHLFILCSDGLQSQWSLDDFPGIETRHPAVIAAMLYKKHWRVRDDVTVVAIRRR